MKVRANEEEILKLSIKVFGGELQYALLAEESMELGKEALKFNRGIGDIAHLAEEIADVQIMIEKIKIMRGISFKILVEHYTHGKLTRIKELTEKEGQA